MAIGANVVGVTRSQVQENNLNRGMQGANIVVDAYKEKQLLDEQKKQSYLEKMLPMVMGSNATMQELLRTEQGRAAALPYLAKLTGMDPNNLQGYMAKLAMAPASPESMAKMAQTSALRGEIFNSGKNEQPQANTRTVVPDPIKPIVPAPAPANSTVRYQEANFNGAIESPRLPRPVDTKKDLTRGPTDRAAQGSLAVPYTPTPSGTPLDPRDYMPSITTPNSPYNQDPRIKHILDTYVPALGTSAEDRQLQAYAIAREAYPSLFYDNGSFKGVLKGEPAPVSNLSDDEIEAHGIGQAGTYLSSDDKARASSGVARNSDAKKAEDAKIAGERTAKLNALMNIIKSKQPNSPEYVQAVQEYESITGQPFKAPTRDLQQEISAVQKNMSLEDNIVTTENMVSRQGPVPAPGTNLEAQGNLRQMRLDQIAEREAAAQMQAASIERGVAAYKAEQAPQEDWRSIRAAQQTVKPVVPTALRVDPAAPIIPSSDNSVSPRERVIQDREVKQNVAKISRSLDYQWKVSPAMTGLDAQLAQLNANAMNIVQPQGVPAELHPWMTGIMTNWAELDRRKANATIADLAAGADLKAEQAKAVMLDTLSKYFGAKEKLIIASNSDYAKVATAFDDYMKQPHMQKKLDIMSKMKPEDQAGFFATLMQDPYVAPLYKIRKQGYDQMIGDNAMFQGVELMEQNFFNQWRKSGQIGVIPNYSLNEDTLAEPPMMGDGVDQALVDSFK